MKPSQQEKVVALLREAWVTVDYHNHDGELSQKIQDFLREIESPDEAEYEEPFIRPNLKCRLRKDK